MKLRKVSRPIPECPSDISMSAPLESMSKSVLMSVPAPTKVRMVWITKIKDDEREMPQSTFIITLREVHHAIIM